MHFPGEFYFEILGEVKEPVLEFYVGVTASSNVFLNYALS